MFGLGIVAHHARRDMANGLADLIDADVLAVDNGTIGAGSNHRRVWANLTVEDTDWSVVLEDDAVPVNDFHAQLAQVLAAAPTPIVSLYLGQQRPPQYQALVANALAEADAQGAHWITSGHLLHAVAVAIRTELVEDMLAHLRVMPVDQAIGLWARTRGHEIGYCTPSIVDHADVPTLINHADGKPRTPGRVAWSTGTRPHWNSESVRF